MDLKRRLPMLRWSAVRMATATRNITTTGQIGDGREAAAVEYVLANARPGDLDDVLAAIDKFAYEKSILINVGDEKGAAARRSGASRQSRARTRAGHLLRIWRPADRESRSQREGVLR
jgi:catechol O-methyltransferase